MAITFRGQSAKLKKSAASNNRNGFQEVSAPGPRRGTGGFENSPAKKIGPQGLGVKGNNGYSIGSPAKKSCSPITQRSKSPLKMNAALVAGAGQIGKKFVDVGAEVGKAFAPDEEPVAANLVKQDLTNENNKDKRKEVKGVDAGQFAKGVIIPSTSEMDLTLAPTTLTKN